MTDKQKLGWTLIGIGAVGCGVLIGRASARPTIGCDVGSKTGILVITADEGPRTVRGLCEMDPSGHPRVMLEIRP